MKLSSQVIITERTSGSGFYLPKISANKYLELNVKNFTYNANEISPCFHHEKYVFQRDRANYMLLRMQFFLFRRYI